MSRTDSEAEVGQTFTEADVAEYLRSHPDFFERHAALLVGLKLPHPTGAGAVSLMERQVSMLRERNGELDRQFKDLLSVARQNNDLVEKIHQLSVKLMRAVEPAARLEQLENSLREDFAAESAVLVLFPSAGRAWPERPGFVEHIDRDDPSLKPFAAFLKAARPRCGPIRDRQRELLFSRDASSIASAAMVPLGAAAELGFLVIGSRDPDHFHPGKRVDFLHRLGELVAAALDTEQAGRAAS